MKPGTYQDYIPMIKYCAPEVVIEIQYKLYIVVSEQATNFEIIYEHRMNTYFKCVKVEIIIIFFECCALFEMLPE